MNPIAFEHRPFSNNPIEHELVQIERELATLEKLKQRQNLDLAKSAASGGLSAGLALGAGWVGLNSLDWLLGPKKEEHKTVTRASCLGLSALVAFGCYKLIYTPPKSLETIREDMLMSIATEKLIFSEPFSRSIERQLDQIVPSCPITWRYPRFLVRKIDRNHDQTSGNSIVTYDWAALQWKLDQPADERGLGLRLRGQADFVFCEDLCRRIHRILYSAGLVRSEDPIEALRIELFNRKELVNRNAPAEQQEV